VVVDRREQDANADVDGRDPPPGSPARRAAVPRAALDQVNYDDSGPDSSAQAAIGAAAELPPPAPDAPKMTLAQLQGLALANNPTLEQARALTWRAYGGYVQAGLYPNPTLGYMGSEIGNSGTAGQQGAFIEQEFVTGGKLRLNQDVQARRQQQAMQSLAAQERRVLTAVHREYVGVLGAQMLLAFQQDLLTRIANLRRLVTNLRDPAQLQKMLQQFSRPEIALLQTEVARYESQFAAAASERDAAWQRLSAVVGQPLEPVSLAGSLEQLPAPPSHDELWYRIVAESPQLAGARLGMARAQAAVSAAEAQVIPNVTVQAAPMYDYASREPMANVQVGLPLPIFNRNQGNILSAESDVVRASREIQRTEQMLRRELATEYQRYAAARALVDQYRPILESTDRGLELTLSLFPRQVDAVATVTELRAFVEARQRYIEALKDMGQSAASLEGLLLVDGLAEPAMTEGEQP
jgi:cobalt-zinc-cadmium efflux system outer membrane protein